MAEDLLRHFAAPREGGAALLARSPDRGARRRSARPRRWSGRTSRRRTSSSASSTSRWWSTAIPLRRRARRGGDRRPASAPIGIERIAFDRGVTARNCWRSSASLAAAQARRDARRRRPPRGALLAAHPRGPPAAAAADGVGPRDIRAIRQSYRNAVAGAEAIWEQAQAEGGPDPEHGHCASSKAWRAPSARTGARCWRSRRCAATTTTRSRTW